MGGEASAHELSLPLSLSLSLALFSAQGTIELFHSFAVWGGGFCSRGETILRARQNSPPLLQCGGGGFCSRGEAFSSHDRLLPLFCSMGGEASTHEGKQRRLLRARQNSPPLLQCGGGQRPEHNNQHQQQQESSLSREIE